VEEFAPAREQFALIVDQLQSAVVLGMGQIRSGGAWGSRQRGLWASLIAGAE
jgi:hypothetical protein